MFKILEQQVMRIRALTLIIILSMSYIPLPSAQAQVGVPDVNLECETGTIDMKARLE